MRVCLLCSVLVMARQRLIWLKRKPMIQNERKSPMLTTTRSDQSIRARTRRGDCGPVARLGLLSICFASAPALPPRPDSPEPPKTVCGSPAARVPRVLFTPPQSLKNRGTRFASVDSPALPTESTDSRALLAHAFGLPLEKNPVFSAHRETGKPTDERRGAAALCSTRPRRDESASRKTIMQSRPKAAQAKTCGQPLRQSSSRS